MTVFRKWAINALALNIALGSAAVEVALREYFHQLSAEVQRIAWLLLLWIVLNGLLLAASAWRRESAGRFVRRLCVLTGGLAALYFVLGEQIASVDPAAAHRFAWPIVIAVGLVVVVVAKAATADLWGRSRAAVALACVLSVAVELIIGVAAAEPRRWPPSDGSEQQATGAKGKSAVVFLLLDEMNASSAPPFVEMLRRHGLPVTEKTLQPIGNATASVLPAMFTGKRFEDAKPCGLTVICSGTKVLDFARIDASRPDIDVVGFYMPYCAIRGLRSCVRASPRSVLTDPMRWRCAVMRRFGQATAEALHECADRQMRGWGDFVAGIESAIQKAPLWTNGGMMFAHVPLPHPPGATPEASLETHYRENLLRAQRLVESLVVRSRKAGLDDFTLVLFSDHPLRPELWCSAPAYAHNGCPVPPELLDHRVPLIVAGSARVDISRISGNESIFQLAQGLR